MPKFFAPNGPDAIQTGGFIDDEGQRFMVICFTDDDGDEVIVNMLIPLFQAFAAQLGEAAKASATRDFWRDVPRP
ncbi:MAG: hypothetical protein WBZ57_02400 [Pseudomonas graminis]